MLSVIVLELGQVLTVIAHRPTIPNDRSTVNQCQYAVLISAAVMGKIDVRELATVAAQSGPQSVAGVDRQDIPNTV